MSKQKTVHEPMIPDQLIDRLRVPPAKRVRLTKYDAASILTKELKALKKDELKQRAQVILDRNRAALADAQSLLYADDRYAVLIILQGIDASGKDGTIRHVMSGINPQGCEVHSFKQPTSEELDHDFLWRCNRKLPGRGTIGIFNRSHYEEVLVAKVHPDLLAGQKLPPGKRGKSFWQDRYESINDFEKHLVRNGTVILKFFLNISKQEQKRRFLERLERPDKFWKFSPSDVAERQYWDDYMLAYEEMLSATSTEVAPWYVIPANTKWAARAVIADIVTTKICSLNLQYPEVAKEQKKAMAAARETLERE